MKYQRRYRRAVLGALLAAVCGFSALRAVAENPQFEAVRQSISGGGGMHSTGGGFDVSATIGLPTDGVLTGGAFGVSSGFWFGVAPADCDEDGSVGLSDYWAFEGCVTGPGGLVAAGCGCFDLDRSGTVDLYDFGLLQQVLTDGRPSPGDPSVTRVVGQVLFDPPDARPFSGAVVELIGHERSTTSDDEGRFEFADVPADATVIEVSVSASADGQALFANGSAKPVGGSVTDLGIMILSELSR